MSWAYRKPRTGGQRPIALTGAVLSRPPVPTATRRTRTIVVAGLVLGAGLVERSGSVARAPRTDRRARPGSVGRRAEHAVGPVGSAADLVDPGRDRGAAAAPAARPLPPGGPGGADGIVPDGVTVFDGGLPAVGNLDPDLLDALRRAAIAAEADGVTFVVTSGWRSPQHQAQLLREAVATHGSEEEAARWVATPETSAHVSGDAVDLGSDASAWLSRHGAEYGLCPVYANEPWHHELRPDAVEHGCPALFADPTQDPRMQR